MKKYFDQISKKVWIILSIFLAVIVVGDMFTAMFPPDRPEAPPGMPIPVGYEVTRIDETVGILTDGKASDILVRTARGGLLEAVFKIENNNYRLTFSPDGRYLIDGIYGKITRNAVSDLEFSTDNCSNVGFFYPFIISAFQDKYGKSIHCTGG